MKNFLLTLFLLISLGSASLFAQNLNEGFEGATFPPSGWTTFIGANGEGTAQNWQILFSSTITGSQSAYVRYESVANAAEDWLVTRQLAPTIGNSTLSFSQKQGYPSNYGTIYTVRVSTASQNTIADFTIVDTQAEADFSTSTSTHTVDLSAYVGQQIYVAFVMENNNGDNWIIDDVTGIPIVPTPIVCDAALTATTDIPVSGDISWTAATGDALGYKVTAGTTTGSNDLIDNVDVGNVLTTNLGTLMQGTTYYVTITPYSANGDASGCTEQTFTTAAAPSCSSNETTTQDLACGNFDINFSWDAATGANGYTVNVGTTSGGTDVVNELTTASLIAFLSGDAVMLSTTYFYTIIPFGNGGDAIGCTEMTFTTAATGCYCTASSTSSSTYLDDFTTTGGDNNISNLGSGFTTGGYQDATSQVVSTFAGNSINFSTGIVGGSLGTAIWVDWNNDLIFDIASEEVFTTIGYDFNQAGTIMVPLGTLEGNYRMRVKVDYNDSSPEPCSNSDTRSETEDYTFSVVAPPSCISPSSLTTTNITATSADLAWTSGGSGETVWDIELVDITAGGTQMMIVANNDVTNPYTATGLTGNNQYEFYVRADCGMDDTDVSDWAGPFPFTTPCGSEAIPYLQDFSSGFLPDVCWSEGDNTDVATGPNGFNGAWSSDGFMNNGTTGAAKINLYSTGKMDWVVTPTFDIPTTGMHQVEYDFGIVDFGTTTIVNLGSDDVVLFLVSSDGGTTWNTIATYDATYTTPSGGDHPVYDLSAYAGQTVQFAFWGSEGTVDDSEDNDIFFDNFQVRETPVCSAPVGTTAIVNDCANNQFSVVVTLTDNGDGTPTVTDDQGNTPFALSGTAITAGPYTSGTTVNLTLNHGSDTACDDILGDFTFDCPPANDDCVNAETLVCNAPAVSGTTTSTTDTSSPGTCSMSNYGVWYTFTGNGDEVTITTTAAFDHEMAILSTDNDCSGTLTTIICDDNTTGDESHTFITVTSTVYYVYVSHYSASSTTTGDITIELTCVAANDDCVDAININGGGTSGAPTGTPINGDTENATTSTTAASNCAPGDADDDVWFVFTADSNGGLATVNVTGIGSFSPGFEIFVPMTGNTDCSGGLIALEICGTTTADVTLVADQVCYVRVYDIGTGISGGATERAAGAFTIAVAGSALPAELTTFTGKAMDKYNTLKWETASEQNTFEFAIERSFNGRDNWEVIGTERAAGNSGAVLDYSFDDMRPATQGYYRLNVIDLDGSAQTSGIVSIKRDAGGFDVVMVAPNPTTAKTTVTFESLNDAQVDAVVTDITGKVVSIVTQNAERGTNNMTIDLTNTPVGVYFLTMTNGVRNITCRIVKN